MVAGSNPVTPTGKSLENQMIFEAFAFLSFPKFRAVDATVEAHQQILGGYAKSLANLKKKNLRSVTPLSCALKAFIFALKLSAKALVERFTK